MARQIFKDAFSAHVAGTLMTQFLALVIAAFEWAATDLGTDVLRFNLEPQCNGLLPDQRLCLSDFVGYVPIKSLLLSSTAKLATLMPATAHARPADTLALGRRPSVVLVAGNREFLASAAAFRRQHL
jgi:hypothetical protein